MALPFVNIRVEVRSGMDRITPAVEARAQLVLQKSARDIEGRAKALVPVDTGALKSSIQAKPAARLTWEITVGQHYGVYVEFGTHKMGARPFLLPAFEAVRPAFERAMAQAVQGGAQEGAV